MYNIKLSGLDTGRKYYVKVRAKVQGLQTSEWSIPFQFTAPRDVMPPGRVQNLSFLSEGDSFVAKWEAPTINEDGTPCADVSYYTLDFKDLDRNVTVARKTSEVSLSVDFNQNKSMFGTPAGRIELTVRAVDLSGNIGKPVVAIAQNPPPSQVKDVKAVAGLEAIHLSWAPNTTDTDLKHYEIHVASTSGFTPSQSTLRATIAPETSSFLYDSASLTVLFIKIIAVDKFNQKSIPSEVVSAQPRLTTDYDKEPPGAVTGFAVEQILSENNTSAIAHVSFNFVADDDIDKYEVQYKKTGSVTVPWSFASIPSDQNSAEIGPLPLETDYDFRIRAVDYNSNKGVWSSTVKASGVKKDSLPPAPTNIVVRGGMTNLMVTWTESVDPTMANWSGTYEVQVSETSGFANPVTIKTSSTLASFTNLKADTVYYVRIRSIDPYSNVSNWSAVSSGNTGNVVDSNSSEITWSPTAPSEGKENDLWIKTPENTQYRYVNGKWESAQDILLKALESQNGDLVINGSGSMGNNYNFAPAIFDSSDTPPGAPGAFRYSAYTTLSTSQIIPLNPNKKYKISMMVKNPNPSIKSGFCAGLNPYDAEGLPISVNQYAYLPNTTTTLAKPVANGDTEVHLTNSANWYGRPEKPAGANTHLRSIIVWNYVDGFGKAWEPLTYSRNSRIRFYEDGAIDPNTHIITLNAPWNLGPAPAGTVISAATSGGTYMYSGTGVLPASWEERAAVLGSPMKSPGTASEGRSAATIASGLPPGTAGAKIIILPNHPNFSDPGSSMLFSNVSVSDASAAYDRATSAMESVDSKNKNIYSVNPASGTSLSGYSFINGDTWYQKDANSTIIGMWEFMNGLWNSKALNNQVIANLDAGKITSGFIDADRIAGKTITGDKIAAGSIVVGNIAKDAIDSTVIKDGAITTGKIAAGSVTAEELAADSVIADKIKAGEITGDKIAANAAIINNLKVQSSVEINSAGGHIKSSNYSADGTAGFYMDQQQLIINEGKIKAAAIELQDSQNLLPSVFAGLNHSYKAYEKLVQSEDGAVTYYWPSAGRGLNGALAHHGINTTVRLTPSAASQSLYLEGGNKYIVSGYLRMYSESGSGTANASLGLLHYGVLTGEAGSVWSQVTTATSQTEYVRVQFVFFPAVDVIGAITLKNNGPGTAIPVWSCFQVERVVAASEQASPWTPPGNTSIDGESIVTGSISSRETVSTANGDIALWSIDTWGKARFADATIDGKLIVGGREGADNVNTYIQSDNYSVGNSGWAIKGDGNVEFNNGLFRGVLSLERVGSSDVPLKMTASVSDIKLYTDEQNFKNINVGSIRGVTYAYDRRLVAGQEDRYEPTTPNPSKIGQYFIGPTTDRSVNIQVHDGEEGSIYLDQQSEGVTLSSLNIGEITTPTSEPATRERQGFRYTTSRYESDPSDASRRNSVEATQVSSVRLSSPFYPEQSDESEYPESNHKFDSTVDYKASKSKNLIDRLYALPANNSGAIAPKDKDEYYFAYGLSNDASRSSNIDIEVSGGSLKVGKKYIFSAHVDTRRQDSSIGAFAYRNGVALDPLIGNNQEMTDEHDNLMHTNPLSSLAPVYYYDFKNVASNQDVDNQGSLTNKLRVSGYNSVGQSAQITSSRFYTTSTHSHAGGMTISMWVKYWTGAATGSRVLFHRANGDLSSEIWLSLNEQNGQVSGGLVGSTRKEWTTGVGLVQPDTWSHLVLDIPTKSTGAGYALFYLNGELKETIQTNGFYPTFNQDVYFFGNNQQLTQPFVGFLSDIGIWHSRLSTPQVELLYSAGHAGEYSGGPTTTKSKGLVVDPGRSKNRVSFVFTATDTNKFPIQAQITGATGPVYLYKVQLEELSYKEDMSLPQEIRDITRPTPWSSNGVESSSSAQLSLNSKPAVDYTTWAAASLPGLEEMKVGESADRNSFAEMELNLSTSLVDPVWITDGSVSVDAKYKWSPLGVSYPGTKNPYMPTAAWISWDYTSLSDSSKPQLTNTNRELTINATNETTGDIKISDGISIHDDFNRANQNPIRAPWISVGTYGMTRIIGDKVARGGSVPGGSLSFNFFNYHQTKLYSVNQEVQAFVRHYTPQFTSYYANVVLMTNVDPVKDSYVAVRLFRDKIYVTSRLNGQVNYDNSFAAGRDVKGTATFKVQRENNTLRVFIDNQQRLSINVPNMPTGKHVGFGLNNGVLDNFRARDMMPGSTAYGSIEPGSVNVNTGRGIEIQENGSVQILSPGFYNVYASIASNMGGSADRRYWLSIIDRHGGTNRIHYLTGNYSSDSGMTHITGHATVYLRGFVELRIHHDVNAISRVSNVEWVIARVI